MNAPLPRLTVQTFLDCVKNMAPREWQDLEGKTLLLEAIVLAAHTRVTALVREWEKAPCADLLDFQERFGRLVLSVAPVGTKYDGCGTEFVDAFIKIPKFGKGVRIFVGPAGLGYECVVDNSANSTVDLEAMP